jgi:hypothetical protein
VATLKQLGAEDALPWSNESENDLLGFIWSEWVVVVPAVVLMDNGNLRAVWRRGQEQVGLEFRGFGRVSFVLFAARDHGRMIARMAGEDRLKEIAGKIAADGLMELLSGPR